MMVAEVHQAPGAVDAHLPDPAAGDGVGLKRAPLSTSTRAPARGQDVGARSSSHRMVSSDVMQVVVVTVDGGS